MNSTKMSARQWNGLVAAILEAERLSRALDSWDNEQYEKRKATREAAYAALREALAAAPWGANGAAFVTQWSEGIGSGRYRKDLWINRCHVATRHHNGRVEVHAVDVTEARRRIREEKIVKGRWQQRYDLLLTEVGEMILGAGLTRAPEDNSGFSLENWTFENGQRGGCFRRATDGTCVSAPGAFKRAAKIAAARNIAHG